MIVETPLDFDWDEAMAKLATLPRQQEWEDYMSVFQKAAPVRLRRKSGNRWRECFTFMSDFKL